MASPNFQHITPATKPQPRKSPLIMPQSEATTGTKPKPKVTELIRQAKDHINLLKPVSVDPTARLEHCKAAEELLDQLYKTVGNLYKNYCHQRKMLENGEKSEAQTTEDTTEVEKLDNQIMNMRALRSEEARKVRRLEEEKTNLKNHFESEKRWFDEVKTNLREQLTRDREEGAALREKNEALEAELATLKKDKDVPLSTGTSKKNEAMQRSTNATEPKCQMKESLSNTGQAKNKRSRSEDDTDDGDTQQQVKRQRTEDEAKMKISNRKHLIEQFVPVDLRRKFAYKPQSMPRRLKSGIRDSTWMKAVLQALVPHIDAVRLYLERGAEQNPYATPKHQDRTEAEKKAAKDFIDLIAEMQKDNSMPMNATQFQESFLEAYSTKFTKHGEQNAVQFLETLLSCITCDKIEKDFNLRLQFRAHCGSCDPQNTRLHVSDVDSAKILKLNKPMSQRRPDPRHPVSYAQLLRERTNTPEVAACPSCKRTDTMRQLNEIGSPETLIVQFERFDTASHKTREYQYGVDIPAELNESDNVNFKGGKCRYELTAVIKHRGLTMDGGAYTTIRKTEDGQWWRCSADGAVSRTTFEWDVRHNRMDGDVYLMFYKLVEGERR